MIFRVFLRSSYRIGMFLGYLISFWGKQLMLGARLSSNEKLVCSSKYVWIIPKTGPHSAFGKVSGNRCESDCRSRGREFDPSPVPYFRGD